MRFVEKSSFTDQSSNPVDSTSESVEPMRDDLTVVRNESVIDTKRKKDGLVEIILVKALEEKLKNLSAIYRFLQVYHAEKEINDTFTTGKERQL